MPVTRIDIQLEQEIDALVRRLQNISKTSKKESFDAIKKATPLLIKTIQANAPVSKKPHTRYKDIKVVDGQLLRTSYTYFPGNLRRSIKVLNFGRRSRSVFVGPKLDKTGSSDDYKGNRVDGYYAHWMEYGAPAAGIPARPFIRPAIAMVGPEVLRIAIKNLMEKIKNI